MSHQCTDPPRVCPSRCYLSGEGMWRATIARAASFTLHTVTEQGNPCPETVPSRHISCQLDFVVGGRTKCLRPSLLCRETSEYEFSYTVTHTLREATLSVRIYDEDIAGSPCSVIVSVPVAIHAMKSGPVEIMSNLSSPYGIAVLSDRMRVISECGREHCISVYGHDGRKAYSFGSQGSRPGQLKCPRGLTLDLNDDIYIADSENHRIQKFTKSGKLLASIGKEGKKPLQFRHPSGLCVAQVSLKVFIADTDNHRVQVLNSDLTFSHTFGKKGSDPGQFNGPCDVAVSLSSLVYVADTNNNRVVVTTDNGSFIRQFGQDISPERYLHKPLGIAVDCRDVAIVTSSLNHRVFVYDSHGSVLLVLGKYGDYSLLKQSERKIFMSGERPGEFNMPAGVTIDAGGFVYIVDKVNNRVQLYL